MEQIILSNHARAALQVGSKNHWRFKVLGTGRVLTEPVYTDSWWLAPATEIPADGQERINALTRAGISIKGVVMAHEAPKLLTAPKAQPAPQPVQAPQGVPASDPTPILTGLLLAVGLVFQAMLIDPALIVVLEDGTYLELMTWFE